jgi:hypothetical protein
MQSGIRPELFRPHPGLSEQINRNIIQSEIEGGVHLDALAAGEELEVTTQNRRYRIVNRGGGQVLISGHPRYCPEPKPAYIHGSTWGGTMLKTRFIGRGMFLEFGPVGGRVITTSRVVEVRAIQKKQ